MAQTPAVAAFFQELDRLQQLSDDAFSKGSHFPKFLDQPARALHERAQQIEQQLRASRWETFPNILKTFDQSIEACQAQQKVSNATLFSSSQILSQLAEETGAQFSPLAEEVNRLFNHYAAVMRRLQLYDF